MIHTAHELIDTMLNTHFASDEAAGRRPFFRGPKESDDCAQPAAAPDPKRTRSKKQTFMRAMPSRNTLAVLLLSAVVALGAVAAGLPAWPGAAATPAASPAPAMTAEEAIAAVTTADGPLRFDVAEDATRFVFAP